LQLADFGMESKKKSKLRMAWNTFKKQKQGDGENYGLIFGGGLVLTLMVLAIIKLHLYQELFFYLGVLAIVGWIFLWLASKKWKTRFSSKRAQNMEKFVRYFLVYFVLGLGGLAFFSYILGNRLGGGRFVEIAGVALFLTFGGIIYVWVYVRKIPDFIRRLQRRGKNE
jgi:hypothetical protein